MKKFISALLSAAMTLGSVNAVVGSVSIANAADTDADIVVFGDSIAAGYTRDGNVDYNYGDICADYLGGTVTNYAVSGDTTADLISVVENLSDSQKETLKNAEYVFISAGGNDIIHYASSYVISYAARKGFLNEGYTLDNIPEQPSLNDLYTIVNLRGEGGVMDFVDSGMNAVLELGAELRTVSANLRTTELPTKVMPNIQTAVSDIKAINPDAKIIIQTIYNPFEISKEYVTSRYGENSNYGTMLGQVRSNINNVMVEYQKELNAYAATDENIMVADVFYQFKGLGDASANNANPGFTYCFTDMQQDDLKDADFHPNQKGHLAIAATYLDTIGILHNDNGLLSSIYKNLEDKSSYPEIPLATLKKVAGISDVLLGDVDGDGLITAMDASAVLTYYVSIGTPDADKLNINLEAADYDHNGKIDAMDASAILTYYVNQ